MTTSIQSNKRCGKYVLPVLILTSLVGCSTQRIPMKNYDLASFSIDCSNAEKQLNYLRDMRPNIYDRREALQQKTIFGGFSSDYEKNKDIVTGKIDFIIDQKIKEIYYKCDR
jgi:hypothetical protein